MSRRPSIGAVILLVLVGVGVVVFAAFRLLSPSAWADRAHDRAVERWESHEPAVYAFDLTYCDGSCAPCELHVEVRDGAVADVEGELDACPFPAGEPPTMEDVFALEESVRHRASTDSWDVEYDASHGYPRSLSTLCGDGVADCGTGLTVSDFEAVP